MKILFVYDDMPGVYQNYLNSLLNVIKKKLNVKTFTYSNSSKSDYRSGNNKFKDKLQRLYYKFGLTQIPTSDLKYMLQFDVIHLQHSYLWKKTLPLLELKEKHKLVITLRGGDTYLKPWSYQTLANFYKRDSTCVDAFIVMSENQKAYLRSWGVSGNKIYVVPISFGEKSLAIPKYPSQSILKIVSAFRMTWEKNIEGHLQFAKELKERGVPFVYDIYGNGSDLDQLYFLVDKYNLKDCVNIKGEILNETLKSVLITYDFFLQLSISESLGMGVIEAQAHGVPCIVSDAGGLPEAVIENSTALVCSEPISKIVEDTVSLWKDSNRYYQFSEAAIAFVNSNFTLDHELNRLEKLYTSI